MLAAAVCNDIRPASPAKADLNLGRWMRPGKGGVAGLEGRGHQPRSEAVLGGLCYGLRVRTESGRQAGGGGRRARKTGVGNRRQ